MPDASARATAARERARVLLEEGVRDSHPDLDRHSYHHGRSSESGG